MYTAFSKAIHLILCTDSSLHLKSKYIRSRILEDSVVRIHIICRQCSCSINTVIIGDTRSRIYSKLDAILRLNFIEVRLHDGIKIKYNHASVSLSIENKT